MSSPSAELLTLEPAKARTLLLASGWVYKKGELTPPDYKTSPNFRPFLLRTAQSYARQMAKGLWQPTPGLMMLDEGGSLIDGQHRCWACWNAKTPICVVLTTGVENDLGEGQGKPRTLGDYLRHIGETNVNLLASAVRTLRQHIVCGLNQHDACRYPSIAEYLGVLKAHPALRVSVRRTNHTLRGFRPGLCAALHYITSQIDPEKADDFFNDVSLGTNCTADNPAFRLRERLIAEFGMANSVGRGKRLLPTDVTALAIMAWNYYYEDRPCTRLRWTRFGRTKQPFPLISGDNLGARERRAAGEGDA